MGLHGTEEPVLQHLLLPWWQAALVRWQKDDRMQKLHTEAQEASWASRCLGGKH